jgi:hypothetical protein
MDLHPDIERLALLGWRLHPTSRRTRAACFPDAVTLATSDLGQLARWSSEYPLSGWRVVMEGSGIWALDIDVPSQRHKHDGVTALRELVAAHGPLPPRPTTRSGGGGLALFFAHRGEPIIGKGGPSRTRHRSSAGPPICHGPSVYPPRYRPTLPLVRCSLGAGASAGSWLAAPYGCASADDGAPRTSTAAF